MAPEGGKSEKKEWAMSQELLRGGRYASRRSLFRGGLVCMLQAWPKSCRVTDQRRTEKRRGSKDKSEGFRLGV